MNPTFFSICIPQHNRTSFLLKELEAFSKQTFQDFELCISDDCSTDGRANEIVKYLEKSGMRYRFKQLERNGRYDVNLRSAIGLATGRYCLLMGNDDLPAEAETLAQLNGELEKHQWPEAAITNYRELSSGRTFLRVPHTVDLGSGAHVAAANFRNLSFVSGIILDRALAQQHATEKWDGTAMYQMYLCSRIVAAGGRLLAINRVAILKDIQIPGEAVDSYAKRPVLKKCPIVERPLNLAPLGLLAFDAVEPYIPPGRRDSFGRRIFLQLLLFTFPPWIIEYRKIQSWRYALGICLGMRPRNLLRSLNFGAATTSLLKIVYGLVCVAGLSVPVTLFEKVKPQLHRLAKASR